MGECGSSTWNLASHRCRRDSPDRTARVRLIGAFLAAQGEQLMEARLCASSAVCSLASAATRSLTPHEPTQEVTHAALSV